MGMHVLVGALRIVNVISRGPGDRWAENKEEGGGVAYLEFRYIQQLDEGHDHPCDGDDCRREAEEDGDPVMPNGSGG